MLDRIVFGDNQFFGINHMSEDKADALGERFRDLDAIVDVIDCAYERGIRAFMLNTHARTRDICDHLRRHPERYPDLVLYPSMPYAHKYASAVAEKGIFGAIRDVLGERGARPGRAFAKLAAGGLSLLNTDLVAIMQMLVDAEMATFRGLRVRAVFLQNIVTDLLLGLDARQFFVAFAEYVTERYGAEPGFITMNLPALVDVLLECGIEDPIVCSSINKIGYLMSPDRASYEEAIRTKPFRPMAMSTMASGAIPPREAIRYVCEQPQIRSIVFGASSGRNIEETKRWIDAYTRGPEEVVARHPAGGLLDGGALGSHAL
jgi:hypothetical protein